MEQKFLVDAMLGKLARWLRILGYDTEYVRYLDDPQIIALARYQKRTLLTKDRKMAQKAPNIAYLVKSVEWEKQVKEIIQVFHLNADYLLSRCPECNQKLIKISPAEAKSLVPLFVAHTFQQFKKCPQCQQVYWNGTHWQRIAKLCHEFLKSQ
ncbi:MAG: uncharacterized protein PWP04_1634 [Candidatus Atribacteria bacterium]|nr:uncharacterized protein [Candidatus Atribacteria bacterium]